jgi:hypothetical protein
MHASKHRARADLCNLEPIQHGFHWAIGRVAHLQNGNRLALTLPVGPRARNVDAEAFALRP